MVKSLTSRQLDVVSLTPIVNLTAEAMHHDFVKVLECVEDVGFEIVAISIDNSTPNRKFVQKILCNGVVQPWVHQPLDNTRKLFIVIDMVHNFKNIYNNILNKKHFACPEFQGKDVKASFDHVEMIWKLERGKPTRMSHKLSDKVLPTPISSGTDKCEIGRWLLPREHH
ncbi:uncharacterized protein LOC131880791 [Tigriopus californicus]|uniref:uncharacterized protein LOC131880791 n=1 Tax=Tigriopus californicus TaxID=6832 RepID=UPI0027D9E771|nr:uncharacterized protein LOC131880791 [Tigriopus californicus]